MSAKRARQVAKRAARKAGGKRALRALRERDQLEQRRAAAHGIDPWVGPERQRKAGRLVRGVREAMARAGTVTRRDVDLEAEGRLVVAPDPTRERAINEALRRREGEVDDGSTDESG